MKNIKDQILSAVNIYKSGNLSEAEKVTNKLILDNPGVAFLYNLLGLILSNQKKIDEAMNCYEKGLKIDPNYAMIYNNIGSLYYTYKIKDYNKKAEDYYKKSISLNNKIPEPYNNLGNLYKSTNKIKDSIKNYKKAIECKPDLFYTHYNLGTAYVGIGNFKSANNHFNKAITISPNFVLAHRLLSRITKYTNKSKHLKELIRLYKDKNTQDTENKMQVAFSLGKAYEDIKNYEKSFDFYKEGNDLNRKRINFSQQEEKKIFENFKNTFNKDLFKKNIKSGYTETSPIFIVGMPRSGTTLVEQILSSHKKVFGAGEIQILPHLFEQVFGSTKLPESFNQITHCKNENLIKAGKSYFQSINKISNFAEITTDKLPINFLNIGFIKLILPNSKIIHVNRNAKDNCFSIFKTHFTSGKIKFAYDLKEIVMYHNLYNDIMKHWKKLLSNFIYTVQYEALVDNTKIEIANLLKFCKLDWDDNCLAFYKNKRSVQTASDTQIRNKIYKTSVESWKNYKKYLNKYFSNLNS